MKKLSHISLLMAFAVFTSAFACQMAGTAAENTAATVPANTGTTNTAPAAEPLDGAPRITLADAKAAFDAGSAYFIDTRAEAAFKSEHIKGAVNIPAASLEAKLKDIPKNKKIIAYCS